MRKQYGFTLIEVILVLVIISMIIVMGIGYMQQKTAAARIDKTSLQMQQILNAGMAFYVIKGTWPKDLDELQKNNFLPKPKILSPWGQEYTVVQGPQTGIAPKLTAPTLLYVYTSITSSTTGSVYGTTTIIAGKLPMAFTTETDPAKGVPDPSKPCTDKSTTCYVAASVNIPGQNLNNASAVNYAGVYRHGGCVPVPQCPIDANGTSMTPQVFIVPVSVSGLNDKDTSVYPISSFTAYPKGPATNPDPCTTNSQLRGGKANPPCGIPNQGKDDKFWRACLNIVTQKGTVNETDSDWGDKVSLAAFTRCQITNEPSGSDFTVFSN